MACSRGAGTQHQLVQQLQVLPRSWSHGASCRCSHAGPNPTAVALALPSQAGSVQSPRKQRLSGSAKRPRRSLKEPKPAVHHVITHVDVSSDLVVLLDVKNQRLIYVVTAESHEPVVSKVQKLLQLSQASNVWIVSEQGKQYAPLALALMDASRCNAWGVNSGINSFHPAQLDLLQQRIAPSPIDGVTIPLQRMLTKQDQADTVAGRMRKPHEDSYAYSYMLERRSHDQQPKNQRRDAHRRLKQLQAWLVQVAQPVSGRLTEDTMLVRNRDLPVVWEQLLPKTRGIGRVGQALGFLPRQDPWSMFDRLSDEEFKDVEVFEPEDRPAATDAAAQEGEDKDSLKQSLMESLQLSGEMESYVDEWARRKQLREPLVNKHGSNGLQLPEELWGMSYIQQELYKAVIRQARSDSDVDDDALASAQIEDSKHSDEVDWAAVAASLRGFNGDIANIPPNLSRMLFMLADGVASHGVGKVGSQADVEESEGDGQEVDGEEDILQLITEIERGQENSSVPHNAAAAAFYHESAEAARAAARLADERSEMVGCGEGDDSEEEGHDDGQDDANNESLLHQPVGSTPEEELMMAMQLRAAQLREQSNPSNRHDVSASSSTDASQDSGASGNSDQGANAQPQGVLAEFYDSDTDQWMAIGGDWSSTPSLSGTDFNCQMQLGDGPNDFTILMRVTPHGKHRSRGLSFRQRLERTFNNDTDHMRSLLQLESQWQTIKGSTSDGAPTIQPPPEGLQRGWVAEPSSSKGQSQLHQQQADSVLVPLQDGGVQQEQGQPSSSSSNASATASDPQQPSASQKHDDLPVLKRPVHIGSQQLTSSSNHDGSTSSKDSSKAERLSSTCQQPAQQSSSSPVGGPQHASSMDAVESGAHNHAGVAMDSKEVAKDVLGRIASEQEAAELAAALAQAQGAFDQVPEQTAPPKGSHLEAIASAVQAALTAESAAMAKPGHSSTSNRHADPHSSAAHASTNSGGSSSSMGHSKAQGGNTAGSSSSSSGAHLQASSSHHTSQHGGAQATGSAAGSKGNSKGTHSSQSRSHEHANGGSNKRSGMANTGHGFAPRHAGVEAQHDNGDSRGTRKEARSSAVKAQLKPKPKPWLPPSVASKSLSERKTSSTGSNKRRARIRPKGITMRSVRRVQDVMGGWARFKLELEEQKASSGFGSAAQGGLNFMQAARVVARLMEITHRPCDGSMIKKGEDVVVVIPGPGIAQQGVKHPRRSGLQTPSTAGPAPMSKMLVTDAGVLEYQGDLLQVVEELVSGGDGSKDDREGQEEGEGEGGAGVVSVSALLQEVAATWNSWEQELMLKGTKAVGISARNEDTDSDDDDDDD